MIWLIWSIRPRCFWSTILIFNVISTILNNRLMISWFCIVKFRIGWFLVWNKRLDNRSAFWCKGLRVLSRIISRILRFKLKERSTNKSTQNLRYLSTMEFLVLWLACGSWVSRTQAPEPNPSSSKSFFLWSIFPKHFSIKKLFWWSTKFNFGSMVKTTIQRATSE